MILRTFIVFLLILAIYISNAFANPFPLRLRLGPETSFSQNVQYGFTYSFEQAAWYGLDPKEAYVDLISNYDFEWVRLPFFWNLMTDDAGNLNLDDLKFAIEGAKKRNLKVVVVLGAKTPFFPEFHLPKNISAKVKFGDSITSSHPIAKEVLEVDRKVVAALAGYDNISHWQIENEPFLANINQLTIDESLLRAEIGVVRSADPLKRPVILSNAARAPYDKKYRKLLALLDKGDVLGVNAYFKTQGVDLLTLKIAGREIHFKWPKWFTWPVQSWLFLAPDYGGIQRDAREMGVDVWVMEMQAEPYIRVIENASGAGFAYNPDDLVKANQFVRSLGFERIGFWGVHFWLFRKNNGDDSWVNAAKTIVNIMD